MIDFLKLRYHVDFRTAAGMVGALRELTPAGREQMAKRQRERERIRAEELAHKEAERQERLELSREILDCNHLHNELANYLTNDRENDSLWDSMASAWELRELHDAEYVRRFV